MRKRRRRYRRRRESRAVVVLVIVTISARRKRMERSYIGQPGSACEGRALLTCLFVLVSGQSKSLFLLKRQEMHLVFILMLAVTVSFKNILFILKFMFADVLVPCIFVHSQQARGQKRAPEILEVELLRVVNHYVGAGNSVLLNTEPSL